MIATQQESDGKVWLYKDGELADFLGSLKTGTAYSESSTYNKASQEETYLYIYGTTANSGSTYRGGKSFTSENKIPSSLIGKTLHVKGEHKNTSSNTNDQAYAYIAGTISSAYLLDNAYSNYIRASKDFGQENDYTEFELVLPITRVGYLSLVGRKVNAGIYGFKFTEVWAE